jgi:hypothetical protein
VFYHWRFNSSQVDRTVTHGLVAKVEVEVDRSWYGKPGYIVVWFVKGWLDVGGHFTESATEPPQKFMLSGEEYANIVATVISGGHNKFDELVWPIYDRLAESGRIAAGVLEHLM